MSTPSRIEISLPVNGLTCPSCVSQVESILRRLSGVSNASADLATARVNLSFDPVRTDLLDIHQAVEEAGFIVPTEELTLVIRGMTCMGCAAHVEGALTDLAGVINADVNLREGTARVQSVQGLVTIARMKETVQALGYEA